MRKTGFFILQLACILTANVFAEDTTNGYIISIYGNALKSSYGECVHTAYYDPDTDQRAECGDVKPVVSAPVEKPKVIIETITLSDADNVLFNFDAATLTTSGIKTIKEFAKKLGAQPEITKVTIDGYTDSIGSGDYNLKLSSERANAVKLFFVQNGIPAGIITVHGYGEQDAKTSGACVAKYGTVDRTRIRQIEQELNSNKNKSQNSQALKQRLQNKLHTLEIKRNDLISCTAADRRVVFTIKHNQQVEKTITVKENASGDVAMSKLAKPPIDGQ